MADNLDARARLSLSVEGLEQSLRVMENAKSTGVDVDKAWAGVQKAFNGVKASAKGAAGAVKEAGDAADRSGKDAAGAGSDWDALSKKVGAAATKYKELSQAAAAAGKTPVNIGSFMAGEGVSTEDLRRYRQGSGAALLGDDTKKIRESQRVSDAAAKQWIANEERKAAEARRASDAAARVWIAAEEKRIAANKKAVAEYDKGMAASAGPDRSRSLLVGSPRSGAQRNLRDAGVADFDRQMAAATAAVGAVSKVEASLPRLRYALYDVATTAGIASTAITGVGVASVAAFASMQSSFTNVERTLDNVSSGQVQALRQELVGLTREIPQSFANISEIATLGNQLGINAGDIAKFTEVTAKFSAVTGLTAEASAQAFGSLGELLNVQSRDYEALGSSIALVGRKSVATEAEIVAMTTRLAASATNAGFTAQQVIALSGAFASLRIAPERAQGVMEVYFNRLNTAINEGGPRLEAFGRIAKLTTEDVAAMAQSDPTQLFRRIAGGLGELNQQAQTGALEELGLQGIRAGEVFGRVSSNVEVFDKAIVDANKGWSEAVELGNQYAKVVDDLASRWQIFLNALQEAGAAVGEALAPTLGAALAILTDVLQKFSDFAKTPFGGWVVGTVAVIGTLVAGLTGLIGMLALSSASFLAIRTALIEFATMAGVAGAETATLSGLMGGLAGSTTVASGAMRILRGAIAATGIGALVLLLASLFTDFNGTMIGTINVIEWLHDATGGLIFPLETLNGILFGLMSVFGISTDQLQAFADAMGNVDIGSVLDKMNADVGSFFSGIVNFFAGIGTAIYDFANGAVRTISGGTAGIVSAVQLMLGPAFGPIMSFLHDVANAINSVLSQFSAGFSIGTDAIDVGGVFDGLRDAFGGASQGSNLLVSATRSAQTAMRNGSSAADDYADILDDLAGTPTGGGARGAAKAVRTLVDYANDLSSVMKRAFDIRFGGQQGLDTISSGWMKIRDAADQAREAVDEHRRSLASMAADKQVKQYWLMVAENYGDELRAAKLRAELADLSSDQAKEQKDLAKAQDKASMTLVGNSEAAIENRSEILGLVGNYQDYLKALAASGMSQKDLQAKSAQLRAEFVQQATRMGYNRTEVDRYARAFDDMATVIQRVPRNITITANANPALQALAEFEAKARKAGAAAGSGYGGAFGDAVRRGVGTVTPTSSSSSSWKNLGYVSGRAMRAGIINGIGVIKLGNRELMSPGSEIDLYGHKDGGYTGGAGVNQITGFVHGQEYVMSAPAVRTLGVNGMAMLHNALKAGKVPAMGAGGGGGMVELSPVDRQLLMTIADRVGVTIDGRSLQAVVNGNNANVAQRRGA